MVLASWPEQQAVCNRPLSRCDLQQVVLSFLQPSSTPPWFSHRVDGLYWMSGSKAELPNMWFRSLNPQGDSMSLRYPCLSGSRTRCVSPNQITSLLFLPDSVWIFLYSCDFRRVILRAFRPISMRVVLHVIVVLLRAGELCVLLLCHLAPTSRPKVKFMN